MDKILPDGKSASSRCAIISDKDQDWAAPRICEVATPALAVYQRPPERHQCANAAFVFTYVFTDTEGTKTILGENRIKRKIYE